MAQGGIPRMTQPRTGSDNTGAGPTPIGATVPQAPTSSEWHPTVVHLLVLLVIEVAAFAALRILFRKVS
jgi:hypothetical protein